MVMIELVAAAADGDRVFIALLSVAFTAPDVFQ